MEKWLNHQFLTDSTVTKDGEPLPSIRHLDITAVTSGRGQIVIGDAQGYLTFLNGDYSTARSFRAYEQRVNHIQQVKSKDYLVTLGDADDWRSPEHRIESREIAKTFQERLDSGERKEFQGDGSGLMLKKNDGLLLIHHLYRPERDTHFRTRSIKLNCSKRGAPLAMSVAEDLSHIAIGFVDGSLMLLQGDFTRDRGKEKILPCQGLDGSRVTNLFFSSRQHPLKPQKQERFLFATTDKGIYSMFLDSSNKTFQCLENVGCEVGCACLSNDNRLVVGAREGVLFYTHNVRALALALARFARR